MFKSLFGIDRRSATLIEPYRQLRFGLIFLGINLVFSLLMLGVFGYYMWDMYSAIRVYFELSEAQSLMTLSKFAVPAGIGCLIIVGFILTTLYFSVKLTHQIYGPLVSVNRFVEELVLGDRPAPVKIRKGDELQDLVARLNQLSGKLRPEALREEPALVQIEKFVDDILEGQHPKSLHMKEDSPLFDLSDKLNRLASKFRFH